MIRLCSKGCEHLLRALMELAAAPEHKALSAKDLCAKAGVPEAYTRKVLHTLVEREVLGATPGQGGSYHLKRPARDISLLEVIEAVEGGALEGTCAIGLENCSDDAPCPVHTEWSKTLDGLKHALANISLEDFARPKR